MRVSFGYKIIYQSKLKLDLPGNVEIKRRAYENQGIDACLVELPPRDNYTSNQRVGFCTEGDVRNFRGYVKEKGTEKNEDFMAGAILIDLDRRTPATGVSIVA
jgi:hypothetical protein